MEICQGKGEISEGKTDTITKRMGEIRKAGSGVSDEKNGKNRF